MIKAKANSMLAYSWFNSYASELVPIFYYRDKTWIHICYFLIKALLHHHNHLNWRPTRRQLLTFRIVVTQTVKLALYIYTCMCVCLSQKWHAFMLLSGQTVLGQYSFHIIKHSQVICKIPFFLVTDFKTVKVFFSKPYNQIFMIVIFVCIFCKLMYPHVSRNWFELIIGHVLFCSALWHIISFIWK